MVSRKNFSFYMPEDFAEKLNKIQAADDKLQPLSMSQALYFIVSDLANSYSGSPECNSEEDNF